MADDTRLILGVPYVFSRQKLQKPFHTEVRTISVRGVVCHKGCGLYYVAPTDEEMKSDDVCPECNEPPKPWSIGRDVEQAEVSVKMAFGNITNVELIRVMGPRIIQRTFNLPQSIAKVSGTSGGEPSK